MHSSRIFYFLTTLITLTLADGPRHGKRGYIHPHGPLLTLPHVSASAGVLVGPHPPHPHPIHGGIGFGGEHVRFDLHTMQQPNYIQNEFKKLVPVSLENLIEEEWKAFKLTYGKSYPTDEVERFRREVFIENRAKIARFNQEYSKGKTNYVQQLNPYGDLLNHEFNQLLNGFRQTTANATGAEIPAPTTFIPSANVAIPNGVDWRQVGAVTGVKSQGACQSCWAFAAAGALEAAWFRKTGQLVDVSEQNLVDCTTEYDNDGCQGGLIDPAFQYIRANNGVDGEEVYPYEGQDGQCRFKRDGVVAQCTGYVNIAEGDEKGMEIAVSTQGPIAVAIDASREGFQFYSDGIYYDPECGNGQDDVNHAVLIVGYGQEPNGQKYWMVKNSYGAQWGIGGYIKMAKEANNHCGIANQATYPLV
ncbi:cathepsin L1-like [Sitophilus oryzae]|uniref:Cathepsin L1-like n=1 Tax=Sitophilus oryzae TaxID=7048 RepID=A0A6J2XM29_SITOR|nr:cathepsin L1-like [Sitophilus oryzae]